MSEAADKHACSGCNPDWIGRQTGAHGPAWRSSVAALAQAVQQPADA